MSQNQNSLLLVPIHLDAYFAPRPAEFTVGPTTDFARLPYASPQGDVHMGRPFLADEIRAAPFQNLNSLLPNGLHLHWSLPRALVRGRHDPATGDTIFPAVPDRWLVTRYANGGSTWQLDEQWVVESNYLYPTGATVPLLTSQIPATASASDSAPFRYMGRSLKFADWQKTTANEPAENYLAGLTATVHGEPGFAAYYPDCSSIFGFYDSDIASTDKLAKMRYEVTGWYSDPANDPVKIAAATGNNFQAEFGWNPGGLESSPPTASVYCARLDFAADISDPAPSIEPAASATGAAANIVTALGESGLEAAAALLAARLPRDKPGKQAGEIWQDQIVFSALFDRLGDPPVDIAGRFSETWHRSGFRALAGGTRWQVRPPVDAELAGQSAWVPALDKLNAAQSAYDAAVERIVALQGQGFRDWWKYMVAQYPPPDNMFSFPDADRVQYFVEEGDLVQLQNLMSRAGMLTIEDDQPVAAPLPHDNLAQDIANAYRELVAILPKTAARDAKDFYQVAVAPAKPYFRPADPVVLLSSSPENAKGPLTPSAAPCVDRDGNLVCFRIESIPVAPAPFAVATSLLDESMQDDGYAFAKLTSFPFHPLSLEWEADIWPVKNGSNLTQGDYSPDMIKENYEWPPGANDLSLANTKVGQAFSVFTGSTLLSSGPIRTLGDALAKRTTARLIEWLMESPENRKEFLNVRKIPTVDPIREDAALADALFQFFISNSPGLKSFFTKQSADIAYSYFFTDQKVDPAKVAVFLEWCAETISTDADVADCLQIVPLRLAADSLDESDCLLQSLGGFHEALLMHHETMQLRPDDPFAFADQARFTERAASLIQRRTHTAPLPLNDFHPIRNGAFRITRLRLVDRFGRFREVPLAAGDMALSPAFATLDDGNASAIPKIAGGPRLSQPARLNVDWVDAAPDVAVSGYLLPNSFNNSLDAYNAAGTPLGSLSAGNATTPLWAPAPGQSPYFDLEDAGAAGPGMAIALTNLRDAGGTVLANFIDQTLNTPAETAVAPGQASEMELLVGRPLAVAQIRVALTLPGGPAVDESWQALALDMNRTTRETNKFEGVNFPLRVGMPDRATDGLLGFWSQTPAEVEVGAFAGYDGPQPSGTTLWSLQPDGDSITFTLIFDPRHPVHIQTGFLPTAAIALSPAEYARTLRNLQVNLLVAPVLNEPAPPKQAGYDWQWTTVQNREWNSETPGRRTPQGVPFGRQTIREGWLQRKPAKE